MVEDLNKEIEKAAEDYKANEGGEELDYVKWDYGHLIKECFHCGHKDIMDRDVEGGISLYLPTTDKHNLKLACGSCGFAIQMKFVKSDKVKPPVEPDSEVKDDLVVEEKVVKRKKKVKKNDTPKGSKEEKPVQADS